MSRPDRKFSQDENVIRFNTYYNYLHYIDEFLDQEYKDWKNFCDLCLKSTESLSGIGNFDKDWLNRFLKIAWNTEYLLSIDLGDIELIRINNQWAPIQAYYAVYAMCEAVAFVLDGNKADGHQKALRKVSSYMVKSDFKPYNLAFIGGLGKKNKDHEPYNFPSNITIPHNLKRFGVQPIQMIAKCLKAEHQHRVDDLWGGRSSGCFKYEFDPGYTTLLHFLYRLRIKSNYRNTELFIANSSEEKIEGFLMSLCKITYWTLLYLEVILIRKCRKKNILELARSYMLDNRKAQILSKRISYYKKAI